MGSTLRYLAVDDDCDLVRAWFDGLEPQPERHPRPKGDLLFFRDLGPVVYDASGAIDVKASPLVRLFPPRLVRGVLWTAGEVHFLPTPLRARCPGLDQVRRRLVRWFGQFEVVFDGKWNGLGSENPYLEGSIRNYDTPVRALPRALAALEQGSYFVSGDDNEDHVDRICRKLALIGVTCTDPLEAGGT